MLSGIHCHLVPPLQLSNCGDFRESNLKVLSGGWDMKICFRACTRSTFFNVNS